MRYTVFKVTFPNGKILVVADRSDNYDWFGGTNPRASRDLTPEMRRDLTLRKQILWESDTASPRETTEVMQRFVAELRADDPAVGYNTPPVGYNKPPRREDGA